MCCGILECLSSWIGCWDFNKEAITRLKPSSKRYCTDVIFLALFIASFVGIFVIIGVAVSNGGDPNRIIHGVDFMGRTCGRTPGVNELPYVAWVAMPESPISLSQCDGCYQIRTCVADCSNESIEKATFVFATNPNGTIADVITPQDTLLFNCVPSDSALFAYDADFNSASELASRAFADLYVSWPVILVSVGVALVAAFIFERLMKTWAGVLVFLAILTAIVGGVLATIAFLSIAASTSDAVAHSRKVSMEALGISCAVITALFTILVIALRQRIYIAVEVVKSAAAAVLDMWSIIFFPLFPMAFGVGYFVLSIATTVTVCSAFSVMATEWPPFFSNSVPGWITEYGPTYQQFSFNQNLRNAYAYIFFHLLWVVQFLIYFSYLVIAGAVANWYFTPRDASNNKVRGNGEDQLSQTPILDAIYRTIRFHLGTVAFGALIIAIIEFIRAVVKYIEKKTMPKKGGPNCVQKCVFCMIDCLLYCVQCCMDKISKNAFIWTAIYGDAYCPAACSSFVLIWANLGRVAALTMVSAFIMFVGKFCVALVTTGICGLAIVNIYGNHLNSPVLPMVTIFLLAYMIASLFMSLAETVVDCVFLCFLVDEKYNKASGQMFADKGLQETINAHHEVCKAHAEEEMRIAERREKGSKYWDEHGGNEQVNAGGVALATATTV